MTYLYYIIGIVIIIYGLVDFKKKPANTPFNRYDNSLYYRLVILITFAVIGGITSLFIK